MNDKFFEILSLCFVEYSSITRIKSDFSSTSPCYCIARAEAEKMMPRFYFHLISNETRIPDDGGKAFDTLNDAHEHGRRLIDKILLHVGYDDADEWKVIVSNDEDDAQLIIPFTVFHCVLSSKLGTKSRLIGWSNSRSPSNCTTCTKRDSNCGQS
jgi:hypothetical protein